MTRMKFVTKREFKTCDFYMSGTFWFENFPNICSAQDRYKVMIKPSVYLSH